LVEGVLVESYGQKVPLKQVANISVTDSQTLAIQPWDRANLAAIEKAISISDLGVNPANDGSIIRISIPPLSAERREELVKMAAQKAENARIAIRNLRHDTMGQIEHQLKAKEIGEDEQKRMEKVVQDQVDVANTEVDKLLKAKEQEIRTV
jgi:ribosome recycling factor